MSSWMRVYRALTAALAPLARRRLARQGRAFENVAGREPERRGLVPEAGGELWLHAASVGELNAALPLIDRLLDTTGHSLVVSTLTPTAASLAARRFADQDRVRSLLAPLDRKNDVRRWLDRTRPDRLLLIETELWPEMLTGCTERSIPVALANARLSASAMRRYRRFRGLYAPLLAGIGPVVCQSTADADRFGELGVPSEQRIVAGNIKFDPAPPMPLPDRIRERLDALGPRPTWIAGSTHKAEEPILARAHGRLLETHPDALLLLVPRHPERAAEAEAALAAAGLRVQRLGALRGDRPERLDAVVIDRLGVLAGLYRHSSANLVGGSLVDGIGGHNLIEAVQAGRPVLTGPFTADQAEAADGLEAVGGLVRVDDDRAVARAVDAAFRQDPVSLGAVEQAGAFLERQRGALARTIDALEEWLDGGPDGGAAPPSE